MEGGENLFYFDPKWTPSKITRRVAAMNKWIYLEIITWIENRLLSIVDFDEYHYFCIESSCGTKRMGWILVIFHCVWREGRLNEVEI